MLWQSSHFLLDLLVNDSKFSVKIFLQHVKALASSFCRYCKISIFYTFFFPVESNMVCFVSWQAIKLTGCCIVAFGMCLYAYRPYVHDTSLLVHLFIFVEYFKWFMVEKPPFMCFWCLLLYFLKKGDLHYFHNKSLSFSLLWLDNRMDMIQKVWILPRIGLNQWRGQKYPIPRHLKHCWNVNARV